MSWSDWPCDLWPGRTTPTGYARQRVNGQLIGLHVQAYVEAYGPVPPGMEVGHLCGRRNCRQPKHLHAVTHRENLLEGDTIAAAKAAQTHCKHGHEFTLENTYRHPKLGTRNCRTCKNEQQRAKRRGVV